MDQGIGEAQTQPQDGRCVDRIRGGFVLRDQVDAEIMQDAQDADPSEKQPLRRGRRVARGDHLSLPGESEHTCHQQPDRL